jgi:D-alanyl-D-alanine carboxypeptidase
MKKIIIGIVLFFLFIGVKALDIKSNNAILYNMNDNNIIYEKNAYEKVQIASLTKIVTAITYIENNSDLDTKVTIKWSMLNGLDGYAKVGLYNGLKISRKDLLYALMLPSAADAAQALAIDNSGSISSFVDLMNEEVEKIGVKNTHFTNPVGMDNIDNYSTAYDMAQILIYALKNDTFKTIFESDSYYISSIDKKINKTVKDKERDYGINTSIIKGAKTGYTDDAGLCLASTSTLNDVNYLLITLGAPTNYPYHITDSIDIYNYYDTNYGYISILNEDDFLVSIKVKYSKLKHYDVYSNKNIKKYLLKTTKKEDIEYKYEGIELITKKIKKGDKLGTISIYLNDEVLDTYDVYLDIDIKYYNFKLYITVILIILAILIIRLRHKKKRKRLSKKKHF